MFSVLLKGESIPSVSIPKAEKSEFSPFQIFRGIQACTKSQPSGEPQALAECPAPCSCCQSLHSQWKASCSHCSKVVLQRCSPPPEECCKPEEMFSFLYVILVSQSWTYWYRACVCDKVVPHQYSSVITSQSKHYWNSFSSVLLLFSPHIFLVMLYSHSTGYPFPTAPPVDPFAKIRVDDCGKTKGCFRSVFDKNAGTFTFANVDWLHSRVWSMFHIHLNIFFLFGNLLYSVGLFCLSKWDYLRTSELWTRLIYDLCIFLKR